MPGEQRTALQKGLAHRFERSRKQGSQPTGGSGGALTILTIDRHGYLPLFIVIGIKHAPCAPTTPFCCDIYSLPRDVVADPLPLDQQRCFPPNALKLPDSGIDFYPKD